MRTHAIMVRVIILLAFAAFSGCTTTAAKKAMDKPTAKDSYTGFDPHASDESKRDSVKLPEVKEDEDPEKAVSVLVETLQKERGKAILAEEQLKWWGLKQGVDKLIVSKVRLLLKNSNVEVRGPALRLTMMYGGNDSNGDLIECLADSEYGIREAAYRALKARTHQDFGFSPSGGEVARAKSVDEWRQWWQQKQRTMAVQTPSIYEVNPPKEPAIVRPSEKKSTKEDPSESSK
jgi:hypothetical protein